MTGRLTVFQTMKDIAEKLSMRRADMFFLKNYESEHEPGMAKNILILMTIKVLVCHIDLYSSLHQFSPEGDHKMRHVHPSICPSIQSDLSEVTGPIFIKLGTVMRYYVGLMHINQI